jgi:hypothetical protein
MPGTATLVCPHCDHSESPLRHTYRSSCGGVVAWQGGTLRCLDCGTTIFQFRCDNCGRILGKGDVD